MTEQLEGEFIYDGSHGSNVHVTFPLLQILLSPPIKITEYSANTFLQYLNMKSSRRQISLKHSKSSTQFHLWRLSNDEYNYFRDTCIPIQRDYGFYLRMYLEDRDDPQPLPRAFVSLQHLFGLSSELFDNWKSSFRFPLLLSLERNSERVFYLLNIFDDRGEIEYDFYRLVDGEINSKITSTCHEPFELEFSREEINLFIAYFKGYLSGIATCSDQLRFQPFLKTIASSNILYGYKNQEFFMQQYDSIDEYNAARQILLDDYGSSIIADKDARTKELLEKIIAE